MSSILFPAGSEGILTSAIDFDTNTIRAALIREGVSTTAMKPITGASNATPIVITATAHGWANGDFVMISGVGGNLAANGLFRIANQAANTFELQTTLDNGNTWTNVVGSGAYTSGGYAVRLTTTQFVSDFTSAKVGTDQTLGTKTTNSPLAGVADAADPTWTAVANPGSAVVGVLVFQFGTNDADSRVIGWWDSKVRVVCAAAAANGATSLAVEPLQAPIASGAAATFTNGLAVTLSSGAAVGARSLSVTALGGTGVPAGHGADYLVNPGSNQQLPLTPNGGNITFAIDANQFRLFSLRGYGLG